MRMHTYDYFQRSHLRIAYSHVHPLQVWSFIFRLQYFMLCSILYIHLFHLLYYTALVSITFLITVLHPLLHELPKTQNTLLP